jgi:hypothetical protein
MRRPDFDVWFDKYQPIESAPETILFETYGEELKKVREQPYLNIWTLLDSNGKLYISPGYHIINRLNYFICKISRTKDERDYLY